MPWRIEIVGNDKETGFIRRRTYTPRSPDEATAIQNAFTQARQVLDDPRLAATPIRVSLGIRPVEPT